ncbi:kinase [Desulfospira joergensenii]|uniref:GHMP family kinase ATP-binding protein n=1 Tax=Desulfospira joergensenii TaxID=53329 RepID=UPI0003B58926|nr:kinase [Desulfospira joergensenii]
MIITRTPFRISFFGGGTDYPAFYKEHNGAVLSTTINKYCYINCRFLPPFFDYKYRIRYTKRETVNDVSQIQHPTVRECLKLCNIEQGVEMVHTSDIPARSGVGSSSAFTVGFLNALYALRGKMTTKRQLGREAIYIEQEMARENVGSQDQVAAAFGGLNRIEFGGEREFFVNPITISESKKSILQDNLLLFFTGFARTASNIAGEQIRLTPERTKELNEMKGFVDEACSILNGSSKSIDDFGKLLHESWMIKRELTGLISNKDIDDIYETAISAGALGGKLCGAGGGGFIIFYVPSNKQQNVRKRLSQLLHVPFGFDSLGSQIIMYSTQDFF